MTAPRIERDSFGQIGVPADHLRGAQTQRSFLHFRVSSERMPREFLLALVQRACAAVNAELGVLAAAKADSQPVPVVIQARYSARRWA